MELAKASWERGGDRQAMRSIALERARYGATIRAKNQKERGLIAEPCPVLVL